MVSKLDEARANLLSTTPKIIYEKVEWKKVENGYKLIVSVFASDIDEPMELRGVVGKTNHSFTLLVKNIPLRRYCNQGYHTARPSGIKIKGHHKHTWHEIYKDDGAYVPNDIDVHADIDTQLMQFLAEQNITLNSGYQKIGSE